ncbi:MAG: CvpA family protein [Oscillospiraceae bacterium]|jgi:uncharacterized membrane protein required for colicin V production|nr:CvpA family protein [Oscillospiraceae bacterium]
MTLVIDIVLLIIIALCTWGGYKRGLVGGIAGLLAIVIALFGGSLLSATYSGEVIPALRPFVGGVIDTPVTEGQILERLGYGSSDKSLNDILAEDPSLCYDYAYGCMDFMGFSADRSTELANRAIKIYESGEAQDLTDAVVTTLCETIPYVLGLLLAFLMILIVLVAIANVGNLSFRLPNMENLDEIGGAVLGFARGFLYCVLLVWMLSFFGILIGRTTLENTTLARFFLSFDFVTRGLL